MNPTQQYRCRAVSLELGASSRQSGPQIPLQSLGVPTPSTIPGLQLCAQVAQVQQSSHHVYLCVEAGSRELHHPQLRCHTDRQPVLQQTQVRVQLRSWMVPALVLHVTLRPLRVHAVQEIGIGLGARLNIAFPEHTDPLYHYTPKPLKPLQLPPDGPISSDEFRLNYYYQICPSLLSWERWHRR